MPDDRVSVLVADDMPVNVKIIKKFIESQGYDVSVANNGQEAVDMYKANRPEIVLMDIMMPVKDGYDATKEIREWDKEHWVPIIFLSAKTSVADQVKAIEMGGDDYLTKPIDLKLLAAKLSAMMRIVNMQRELKIKTEQLVSYVKHADTELDLAKRLMAKMTHTCTAESVENVSLFNAAAKVISGDISMVCQTKSKLYVLLADATGHGLSAAISLIPAIQQFYVLMKREETVSNIVREVNRTLKTILPSDRFVAVTLVAVDETAQSIEVWNGSNPPPMLFDEQGNLLKTFEETNFALGVVGDEIFTSGTETFHYQQNNELFFYSDGLTELRDGSGEFIGVEGVIAALAEKKGLSSGADTLFSVLMDYIDELKSDDGYEDDISLISIRSTL